MCEVNDKMNYEKFKVPQIILPKAGNHEKDTNMYCWILGREASHLRRRLGAAGKASCWTLGGEAGIVDLYVGHLGGLG